MSRGAHNSLQQLCVGHDELLPVHKDQGHFRFSEEARLSHPVLENLSSEHRFNVT